ncbi:vWA domain-containing protein [Amycolatopsis sp. NPDC004772]
MPIYLVVNTSPSMAGRLVEIEHVLTAMTDELLESPLLGDRVRVCLVAFAENARCVLPLSDLTEVTGLPALSPGRETRFGPAFQLLTRLTDADAAAHLAAGVSFHRPLVLLVTDGVPADRGWREALNEFYRHAHPRVILITVGVERSQAQHILDAMQVSGMRLLSDSPDQPLAKQILADLLSYTDQLVTSRAIRHRDDSA